MSGRKPTDSERNRAAAMLDRFDRLEAEELVRDYQPIRPDLNAHGGFSRMQPTTRGNLKPYELRQPGDPKDHRSLFGDRPNTYLEWTDKQTNFFQALYSGRTHPGLVRGMTETILSDGGFAVPTEYEREIYAIALENQIVFPLAYVQPMSSLELVVPAMEIGDHTDSMYGGFIGYYKAETATLTKRQPKMRSVDLKAKKLTGLIRMSNEFIADSPNGKDKVMQVCGNGLGWYRDKAFLKGSGAGEPLGVFNANCLIAVDKENGQDASTITYTNLTQMVARMYSGSFQKSVWVCHQTTIPQLLQLSIPVGTGGSHYPVLKENNGQFSMLTRPVIFTEKTETLGSQGDVLLADFSNYIIGLRDGLRMDVSPHVYFESDESLGRLIERHDAQPLWSKPLKLQDGTTVSPFVTLKARS